MKKGKSENLLLQKLRWTFGILLIYIIGRRVPLYGIDKMWYQQSVQNAEHFLGMTIGGDVYKTSVLALGISPYMVASILVMAVTTVRRASTRSKVSMKRTKHVMYLLTFLIAVYQAVLMVSQMRFVQLPMPVLTVKVIAAVQLIAGAMLIIWFSEANREHGIGGQSVLIIVNVVESIATMLSGCTPEMLVVPVICTAVAVFVTLIMENCEFRMPVQRIFIHNIYKDENYMAIKYNPVGVLPVMFSTAIFVLLQQLSVSAEYLLRDVVDLETFVADFSLMKPLGIAIYFVIVYILTIGFSLIMLNPGEMTEQLLKSNDSICNISSGKQTKAYLARVVLGISLLSASVMSLCVGASLVLQLSGKVDSSLVMLPAISMMFTSILVNLYREVKTAISFESYRVFL